MGVSNVKSIYDLWNLVIEELKKDVSHIAIQTWFDDVEVLDLKDQILSLYCPVKFKRETIEKCYVDKLQKVLRSILSETIEIELLSEEAYQQFLHRKDKRPRPLRECGEYTFDNFIVGQSNRIAYAAALSVVAEHSRYNNPLVIYGASGLGKTHLLNAIATEVSKNNPDATVAYVKGDDFTNDLVEAIFQERNIEFRKKYRSAEYFLMDDVQFIAGKKQTQEEFFNTFDKLYEANCQIVLAIDQPLSDLTTLQDRIRNRFEGGLIVEIDAPDFETRCAIIRSKAAQRQLALTDDEIIMIAQQVTGDVRKLEGVLNRLKAFRAAPGYRPCADDLALSLQGYQPKGGKEVTSQDIVDLVSSHLHVDPKLIVGRSHTRTATHARQIVMYLLCEVHGKTTTSVGKFFGRDHSTVMYAVNKVKERMATDTSTQMIVSKLSNAK